MLDWSLTCPSLVIEYKYCIVSYWIQSVISFCIRWLRDVFLLRLAPKEHRPGPLRRANSSLTFVAAVWFRVYLASIWFTLSFRVVNLSRVSLVSALIDNLSSQEAVSVVSVDGCSPYNSLFLFRTFILSSRRYLTCIAGTQTRSQRRGRYPVVRCDRRASSRCTELKIDGTEISTQYPT